MAIWSISLIGVSMKSGLEGRNNITITLVGAFPEMVSMKSGLEGRNNFFSRHSQAASSAMSQ